MTTPESFNTEPQHTPSAPSGGLEGKRSVRVGTMVWGAILVAIAVITVAVAAGTAVDLELAFIIGLVGAGITLIAGSIAAGRRRVQRQ